MNSQINKNKKIVKLRAQEYPGFYSSAETAENVTVRNDSKVSSAVWKE